MDKSNDYYMAHTFKQFDDFLSGRPIRPYDDQGHQNGAQGGYSDQSRYSNYSNYHNHNSSSSDFEKHRQMILNESRHYEPYFSQSTKYPQNNNNRRRFEGGPHSSLNTYSDAYPIVPKRSTTEFTNYTPIVFHSNHATPILTPTTHYVASPGTMLPAISPTLIHPPNVSPRFVSTMTPTYVTKQAPIINTYTMPATTLLPAIAPRRLAPISKQINPIQYTTKDQLQSITRQMPSFPIYNQPYY